MAKQRSLVIVGGALAGPTAAARARETDEHVRIVLLERAANVSYDVGGLPQGLSGEVDSPARLNRLRAEYFRDTYDVEVRTGVEVTGIDPRKRVVRTAGEAVAYDALIFAAGVESIVPPVPGLAGARNVHPFRNLEHLRAISSLARRGRRVVVLGGAFFGVEAADALRRRGVDVTIVERRTRLLTAFSTGASAAARASLEKLGVNVVTNARVVSADVTAGAVRALRLEDGTVIPCNAVVVTAGVQPRTELLGRAGARLLRNGSVRVDDRCRTSLENVWACGVCVSVEHAVSGRLVWFPQASIADKTAQVAGTCAAGGEAKLGPVMGTAIVRVGDVTIARTGLRPGEAEQGDVVSVHAPSHDRFLPDASTVSMDLLYDPRDGSLLGADAWGARGVDKRIDVLATAIAGGLRVEDLAQLDLAYAPSHSTVRDAVNVAGTVAEQSRAAPGIALRAHDVAHRIDALSLIDLRSPASRRGGVIAGSRAMSLPEVRAGSASLREAPGVVVFVSDDGALGYLAARAARARGIADAAYLSGGVASWLAEGHALTGAARAAKPVRKPARRGSR